MKREPTLLVSNHTPEVVRTPEDFLKAIGRASETKVSTETWTKFWNMDGSAMRAAGVGVRDRKWTLFLTRILPLTRYILWCMEKYRLGFPIREFAHDAPPKKTVRGWGPKVQDGKRIRSRRLKNK
ncbi:hypothetical protein CPB83DRAFT_756309 [Crepidotus variabilis]|uniref:Small ribosomal subunit protein mS41 n=1 Tax=Crepidotus variabilis TaxID=179855 RepID=A0A9P6ET69_9AGAR|nr:hypothetical protein CPB83DRAFT_756309 [Crepidotus variabilis]